MENNTPKTVDDLLENPFDIEQPLLEEDMQVAPKKEETPEKLIDRLPEEDREKALQIANQMPVGNYEAVISYGANAQNELSRFSHTMLDHVQSKDVGPVGDILKDLMGKLNEINPEELTEQKQSGIMKLFRKVSKPIQEMMTKYQKLSTQIDRIGVQLEHSKVGLLEDVKMLDQLYDQNKTYFQALNVYIAAAEIKRDELSQEIIPKMRRDAESSNDQMAIQEVNDMVQFLDRLEKRIYDLQLSRQNTIQSAPQIRMIQQTNQTLAEKIQSSIMTSIPLWKNQIAIALTLNKQRKAFESHRLFTETTNDL